MCIFQNLFRRFPQALRRLGKPMAVADDLAFEGGVDPKSAIF